jgi:hypothetical protein
MGRRGSTRLQLLRRFVGVHEQRLAVDLAVGDLGEFGDEVHHLVLEDRGADLGLGLRVFGVELEDLLLLAGELARAFCSPMRARTRPKRTRRSAMS